MFPIPLRPSPVLDRTRGVPWFFRRFQLQNLFVVLLGIEQALGLFRRHLVWRHRLPVGIRLGVVRLFAGSLLLLLLFLLPVLLLIRLLLLLLVLLLLVL